MADQEHVDLHEFDALLREVMAVEPSAEFLPRVRARVAAERRRSASWPWIALAAGSVAAALVLLVLSAQTGPRIVVPPAPRLASAQPAKPPVPDLDSIAAPPVVPRSPALKSRRVPARRAAPPREEAPVVIVDERQRTALAALIRLVGRGQLTEENFARATPAPVTSIRDQMVPVGVAQLDVRPIVVAGVLSGEAER